MLVDAGLFIARLIVGGILLIAGIAKIKAGASQFLSAILGYDLLPPYLATLAARVLPWLEIAAGLSLIFGLGVQIAAVVGFGLLLLFSGAVAISLLRGKSQSCGCFNSLTPVQWRLTYRNLALAGLLLPVYQFRGGLWGVDYPAPAYDAYKLSTGFVILMSLWLGFLIGMLVFHHIMRREAATVSVSD